MSKGKKYTTEDTKEIQAVINSFQSKKSLLEAKVAVLGDALTKKSVELTKAQKLGVKIEVIE